MDVGLNPRLPPVSQGDFGSDEFKFSMSPLGPPEMGLRMPKIVRCDKRIPYRKHPAQCLPIKGP